ncbi:hypothetical protein QBC35DRAFT_474613 [Podospora australis]|uniref:Uncharacterized protein n=1 Tax=Podospora australis TaxID=1536484 RepID=A0AAN6WSL4_9PEZI|nr:hypothetical protein QBC35DRAFT_474613 [Podospora australis]
MKFLATLTLAATGAAAMAMPWAVSPPSTSSSARKHRQQLPDNDDITVHVKFEQHPPVFRSAKEFAKVGDVCWRACFPEAPKCPENWKAKQFGGCWTCCYSESDDVDL